MRHGIELVKPQIGVIGCGFVGGSVLDHFEQAGFPVKGYDLDPAKCRGTLEEVKQSLVVFLCVNTPTRKGNQDLSQVRDACESLRGYKGIVVLKCTVLPGTSAMLAENFGLNIVHNPEFLRAATALEDYKNQKAIIFSGNTGDVYTVSAIHRQAFPGVPILTYEKFEVTELGKYGHNDFSATKVAFMNALYDAAQLCGVDFEEVREVFLSQGIVNEPHTKVPGDNGKRGFSGYCFPKDTVAFMTWTEEMGLRNDVLKGAIEYNESVRPHDENCKEVVTDGN